MVIYNKTINKNTYSRGVGKISDLLNGPVNANHHVQACNLNLFKHMKLCEETVIYSYNNGFISVQC